MRFIMIFHYTNEGNKKKQEDCSKNHFNNALIKKKIL